MFLALAQLTNKAFTDAGKGRIRQSLTALVFQNYAGNDFVTCPFNADHVLPQPEYQYHLANCPDHVAQDQDGGALPDGAQHG